MQKNDPIREHAQAQASAKGARTPALERLKARSLGKLPQPVASGPALPQVTPLPKPLVR